MSLIRAKCAYKLKILVVGGLNSGKTTFCSKLSTYSSGKVFRKSIGVDIFVIDTFKSEDCMITYSCWNVSPKKRFEFYKSAIFRGAVAALVLFDLTDNQSFIEAGEWIKSIKDFFDDIPIILIGNKVDLKENRVIDYETAEEFAKKNELIGYIEISAKENINLENSLKILNEIVYNRLKKKEKEVKKLSDNEIKQQFKDLKLKN
ncbi:MAG: GTP-binding protein [Promethearchaeota archaeon]